MKLVLCSKGQQHGISKSNTEVRCLNSVIALKFLVIAYKLINMHMERLFWRTQTEERTIINTHDLQDTEYGI